MDVGTAAAAAVAADDDTVTGEVGISTGLEPWWWECWATPTADFGFGFGIEFAIAFGSTAVAAVLVVDKVAVGSAAKHFPQGRTAESTVSWGTWAIPRGLAGPGYYRPVVGLVGSGAE